MGSSRTITQLERPPGLQEAQRYGNEFRLPGELGPIGTTMGGMRIRFGWSSSRTEGRIALAFVVGAALITAAGGCSSYPSADPPCFPPDYSVTPTDATPGEMVTVAAPEADCNPRYGETAQIQVVVTDERGVEVINVTAPMTDAGAFTYTFRVPAQMAVGEAVVTATPYKVDWCDDTGRNNRVRGTVGLERASCAEPREPLTITR